MQKLRFSKPISQLSPRAMQLIIITALLVIACTKNFLATPVTMMLMVICTMVIFQMLGNIYIGRSLFHNQASALISSASLLLLFRSNDWWVWLLASTLTIGSKYLIHIRHKHCFNPTNFAIVLLLLADVGWISHGRWGHYWWGIAMLMLLGIMVLSKVRFYQTTVGFLVAYGGVILGRGLYLQDPWPLIAHQFSHISLIIFAFFMISDPGTTPNRASHRWLFGFTVGVVASIWQYWWFEPNAIFYSLFFSYPLVWLLDWLDQGEHQRFNWQTTK